MNGRPGGLRRLRGVLVLAFAIALASGVLVLVGGTLLARARALDVPRSGASRFFVVARGPLAEVTRAALVAYPQVQIVAEHSIDQLLGETASLRTGSETMRVLEVTVPRKPDGDDAESVATLQEIDGVVEVIGLDPPVVPATNAAPRLATVGCGLIVIGCALFIAGLVLSAAMAVRESREEIALRHLLGAEPGTLWRPLGAVLGLTALAGVLGAVLATYLISELLAEGRASGVASVAAGLTSAHRLGLMAATSAFALGAVGSAVLAARRAALRTAQESVRLLAPALVLLSLSLLVAPARAATVPTDWQVLHGVAREIATCRRGLRDAQRVLVGTELGALHAYARQDAVLLRLSSVQREQDARLVEHWRDSCAALETRRGELRLLHRASLSPGPPIAPRKPPVTGGLAVAYGEAGLPGRPNAFRNGVGLRVRPGEEVRAAAAGKVVFSGDLAGSGRVVVISHGRRTYSVYGRVAEAFVVRGMQVDAGEPVASAGPEPRVIYFSVRERGKAIDPVAWLREELPETPGG